MNDTVRKIDPAALSPDDKKLLAAWFKHSNRKVWSANKAYSVNGIAFTLTEQIIKRPRKHYPNQYRYEVVTDITLGEGNFGLFVDIKGTLDEEANFSTDKARVLKIFIRSYFFEALDGNHFLEHLKSKAPVIFGDYVYLVMKKMPGQHLSIKHDRRRFFETLTPTGVLELSLALLQALKRQVRDLGLVHRDIKPKNVMLDSQAIPVLANIVDGDMVMQEGHHQGDQGGSEGYQEPELGIQTPTYLTDVYGMGCVLEKIMDSHDFEMREVESLAIIHVIEQMKSSRENRFSLDTVIARFMTIAKLHCRIEFNLLIKNMIQQSYPEELVAYVKGLQPFPQDLKTPSAIEAYLNQQLGTLDSLIAEHGIPASKEQAVVVSLLRLQSIMHLAPGTSLSASCAMFSHRQAKRENVAGTLSLSKSQ